MARKIFKGSRPQGTPRFNNGDKVIAPIAGEGVLTIDGDGWWNGFTWMFYFKDSNAGLGQEYITKYEPPKVETKFIPGPYYVVGPKTNEEQMQATAELLGKSAEMYELLEEMSAWLINEATFPAGTPGYKFQLKIQKLLKQSNT